MNISEFEKKCTIAKMKVVARADIDGFPVFVADGYNKNGLEHQGPHYRTAYAIGKSPDDLRIMQNIYHDWGEDLGFSDKQDHRIQDAMQQAKSAIKVLKDGGVLRS